MGDGNTRQPVGNTPQGQSHGESDDLVNDTDETHPYRIKLRRKCKSIRGEDSNEVLLVCNITKFLLQDEFYDYVKEMLDILIVDVY